MSDLELVIADTIDHTVELLEMPRTLAERLVRHAFSCTETACGVRRLLDERGTAAVAKTYGVSPELVQDLAENARLATEATLALQRQTFGELSPEQLRVAYEAGRDAVEASLEYLRGPQ